MAEDIVESTESRDNPFVPGGNLSKEADDLLSKSTIIRDKFYIDGQNVSRTDQSGNDPFSESVENKENIDATNNAIPVESTITPEASASVEAKSPKKDKDKEKGKAKSKTKSKTKENGKVDDSVSPDGVKVELSKSTSAPSEEGKSTEAQQDSEKKKKNACCSVM